MKDSIFGQGRVLRAPGNSIWIEECLGIILKFCQRYSGAIP